MTIRYAGESRSGIEFDGASVVELNNQGRSSGCTARMAISNQGGMSLVWAVARRAGSVVGDDMSRDNRRAKERMEVKRLELGEVRSVGKGRQT